MTVNKARVQLLVEALRSDEFSQARESLHEDGGYCCLGVATEVALRNGCTLGGESPWDHFQQDMHPTVAAWYGLERNPKLVARLRTGQVVRHSATVWNDDLGADFHDIADAFEANYLTEHEALPTL